MITWEWWMVTAAANLVMVVVYVFIAWTIWSAIITGHQLRTNPLAVGTGLVFVTCTFGHGIHLEHTLAAALFGEPGIAAAARASFGDPRMVVWDVFTAFTAIYYFTLRSRFPLVWKGAALCDDLAARERQARAMNDQVVQGLAAAKLSLDMGLKEESREQMRETLESAKGIITKLLGDRGSEISLGPGDLRRKMASR